MTLLRIQLLGDFRVFHTDQLLHHTPQTRQQTLLAYLLVHRHVPLSRRRLAFLFWPDSSEKQAHTNLRTTLARLQQDLPELHDLLNSDHRSLHWAADLGCQVDVVDFESALQQAEQAARAGDKHGVIATLRQAVALYTGDFLPHFYDDWALATQARLRNHYVDALEWLITLLKTQADYATAIDYAQRLANYDPLSEAACRHLIALHALYGDRASAVRVYRNFARLLQRELGVEPSQATQALYQQVIQADTSPPMNAHAHGDLLVRFAALCNSQTLATSRNPDNLPGFLKLTGALLEQQRLAEASTLLDQLEDTLPGAPAAAWAAEIHRLRGLVAWQRGEAAHRVEPYFHQAVAVAQQHAAHFLLLRAAVTLVGYQQTQEPTFDPLARLMALGGELSHLLRPFSWPQIQSLCRALA